MNKTRQQIIRFSHSLFTGVVILCCQVAVSAGQVPVHVDNTGIYELLDELAGIGVIDVNSAVKPYSRQEVALFLQKASRDNFLSQRQHGEIDFYLRDFGKELAHGRPSNKRFDLFYYSDSLFRFTVNPIFGVEYNWSGAKNAFHRWNGGEFHGTIGNNFGFYGSLRDNFESEPMGGRQYIVDRRGGVYKGDDGAKEYSEARGGLTWYWQWGELGLHKDHYVWGNGYNGANIFSGNTPSHVFFSLNLRPVDWIELQYMHGWLVSEVVDTTRSFPYYDGTREVFTDKYLAANFVTLKPIPRLNISLGNSIIYADTRLNPAFMIPFLFYKSVDHTYNGASNRVGQNAQMFLDISSRQIKYLHLYSSLFVDEISVNRMFDKAQQSNYASVKAGARLTGIPSDFVFKTEYTRNNPMVYRHIIPTTTWDSNGYNLGHYLEDNAEEIFLSAQYKPARGVTAEVSYSFARKGKDYQSILKDGNEADHPEMNPDEPRWGLPFMNEERWKMQKFVAKGSWQIINDGYVFLSLALQDTAGPDLEKYTPPLYRENGFAGRVGIHYGF